ncbi:MAG: hypothetical protein KBT39_05985, partial [Bacteroidales bacterium]|nr:hypothetical protein [Bacteroidales bacterium]
FAGMLAIWARKSFTYSLFSPPTSKLLLAHSCEKGRFRVKMLADSLFFSGLMFFIRIFALKCQESMISYHHIHSIFTAMKLVDLRKRFQINEL